MIDRGDVVECIHDGKLEKSEQFPMGMKDAKPYLRRGGLYRVQDAGDYPYAWVLLEGVRPPEPNDGVWAAIRFRKLETSTDSVEAMIAKAKPVKAPGTKTPVKMPEDA